MKHLERRARAGTTAVTLLAVLAFCCIVAAAPSGRAVESGIDIASAGPGAGSAPDQGGHQ